ncbi:patatin-like phospholipase family protein [Iamia sp. SCSIO 61187]|uniref:patatin-like phospholipase family protein n=1 Tax=Iamia sp. SCSIO 61187 TaxID=2722752 RepID=UPI001C6378E4|nr:patatin-like phospholipase family protein [Iamia sp. SCSIO 61187]QYG94010.1 patatin-like phospholipase family protein [Iamia sp. SCSIO 61187]
MTTAFVLTGGANLGAIQVGMLLALEEAGIHPDLYVGTSVGAVNATFMAGRPGGGGAQALAGVWSRLRRQDVFPTTPMRSLRSARGREPGLVSPDALGRLVRTHLPYRDLEQAPVPVTVIAVDVCTSADVALSRGPAVEAVLASAAIPGIFPPVDLGGRTFMDGGVVDNAPISHAVALGADTIWVLPAGYACALPEPPRSALGMALQGLNVLVQRRLAHDLEVYGDRADIRVVPPLCPVRVAPTDFSRSQQLVEDGRRSTQQWLRRGRTGGAPIGPHGHMHLGH